MRKRMFFVIAALLVFGLGAAAFAYNRTTVTSKATMSCCCCKGDSCPTKSKDGADKEKASCGDTCDCSKGSDESCPMMKKGDPSGTAMKMAEGSDCPMMKKGDASGTAMKIDGGADCPMMKKDAASGTPAVEMKHSTGDGNGCSCPCCHMDKEKKGAPAI